MSGVAAKTWEMERIEVMKEGLQRSIQHQRRDRERRRWNGTLMERSWEIISFYLVKHRNGSKGYHSEPLSWTRILTQLTKQAVFPGGHEFCKEPPEYNGD